MSLWGAALEPVQWISSGLELLFDFLIEKYYGNKIEMRLRKNKDCLYYSLLFFPLPIGGGARQTIDKHLSI